MAAARADNLRPVRSKSEARTRGETGGKKSGEARRRKRELRERLELLLEKRRGDMDTADALALALVEKGLAGDVRAFEVIRDTLGQNPKQVVEAEISGGLEVTWRS